MDSIFDQKMLRNRQYKTPNNLQARMEIHRRFSQSPVPWFQWEFDALAIQPGQTVLDLGCGPGELWGSNRGQVPENSRVILCDLSNGMVGTAAAALAGSPQFRFMVGDAQSIPLADQCCDLLTANHMLYHVPEIPRAVREIKRVLKKGGRLVAATNGMGHMLELYELIRKVVPGYTHVNDSAMRFGLETGPDQLRPYFDEVEVRLFDSSLWITEAAPLAAYIYSMWGFADIKEDLKAKFLDLIEAEIQARGGFFIQQSAGVLVAR